MATSNASQKGSYVHLYDERGRNTCQLPAGNGPKDGLVGFTGSTVSIRRGNNIYTYDEHGRNTFEKHAY
ncbi:hypothetical protein FHT80_002170 [Rhizobium sp. BK226]|uniref:hypothetical protein n=1 Tax=Rhizobium TaxID=379 RepID=UPI00160C8685|nr:MULTISPECIES: hypothetical protein [Rhizobium]MBB3300940.1 hypothetical protein [Rhizobium sp. BK112]MBB3368563.1 hypothetical protein [Rhizobium sp. BK077]MBB4112848.1 hypothetical protein [Rhizobium sp. BK226]MBB4180830.1 hypothetical protein [Rhizobium sp. BK109]UTS89512.1 hypothetical protein NE851_23235 [Rhizobium anhuiense bv. trifolii]